MGKATYSFSQVRRTWKKLKKGFSQVRRTWEKLYMAQMTVKTKLRPRREGRRPSEKNVSVGHRKGSWALTFSTRGYTCFWPYRTFIPHHEEKPRPGLDQTTTHLPWNLQKQISPSGLPKFFQAKGLITL